MKIGYIALLFVAGIINTAQHSGSRRGAESRSLTVYSMLVKNLDLCPQESPEKQLETHLIKTGRLSAADGFTITEPACYIAKVDLKSCESCGRGISMCICMGSVAPQFCMPSLVPLSCALKGLLGSLCLLPLPRAYRLMRLEVKNNQQ